MPPLTSSEIAGWVGGFVWPLFRIAAMLSVAPVIGARSLPRRVRAALALVLTAVTVPLLPPGPQVEPMSPAGILIGVQQVLIGLYIGFALRLAFAALETGGQMISTQMGLGYASLIDPQNGASTPLLAQFYGLLGMLIFLGLDGHLLLIETVVESFHVLPVSTDGLALQRWRELADAGAMIFAGAVKFALPAMASLLVVNLAFGVMTRAAPQLNIFAVGLPVTLLLGLAILLYSLPALAPEFRRLIDAAFLLVHRALAAGG